MKGRRGFHHFLFYLVSTLWCAILIFRVLPVFLNGQDALRAFAKAHKKKMQPFFKSISLALFTLCGYLMGCCGVLFVNDGFPDGTPVNNTRFNLPCFVDPANAFPAIRCPYMEFYRNSTCPANSNGISPSASPKGLCACPGRSASDPWIGNYFCFTVTATAGNIQFTESSGLLQAVNDHAIIVQTSETSVGGLFSKTFAIKVLSFVQSNDLGVCFNANGSSPTRCVSFHLLLPPDRVELTPLDMGDGLISSASIQNLSAYKRQTLRFAAHDYNQDDQVSIDMIKWNTGSIGRIPSGKWESPANCADNIASADGSCMSGLWRRVFALTPPTDEERLFMTIQGSDDGGRTQAAAAGAVYPAWLDQVLAGYPGSAWQAAVGWSDTLDLGFSYVTATVPATPVAVFLDEQNIPLLSANGTAAGQARGTPSAGSRLPTAWVNCPIPPVSVVASLLFADPKPSNAALLRPTVRVSGSLPPSMASLAGSASSIDNGQFLILQWTPPRGQEGRSHRLCFVTGFGLAATSPCDVPFGAAPDCQRRCFYIDVARCQYCVGKGDTVQSIAAAVGTSWLGIWSANVVPFAGLTDDPLETAPHRRWAADYTPDSLGVGDVVRLGPVYYTRPGDSLAALAARFGGSPAALLALNRDLDPAAAPDALLPPLRPLCVVPRMCV